MAIDLIFSFLLNTWQSFPGINSWADEHMGGVDVIISEIKKEEQILCSLEHNQLLAYDARWKKSEKLKIPKECQDPNTGAESYDLIEYRSESLTSPEKKTAWNHKVDVSLKGHPAFTLYVRADRKYVGAHSTAGWSMWVERKTGSVRYEWIDEQKSCHFRLKARGLINPLKGTIAKLHSMEALYVRQELGKLKKALFVTEDKRGARHTTYFRDGTTWVKGADTCTRKKGCKEPPEISLDEDRLTNFANVSTQKYKDFIEKGHPLAFQKISLEDLVPPTDQFR